MATKRRDALAARRVEMGYTQEALAQKLVVAESTVRRWELGKTDPRLSLWGELAGTLKLSLGELRVLLYPPPGMAVPCTASQNNEPRALRVDHGQFADNSLAAWEPRKLADESYVDMTRTTSQQLIQLDSRWGGIDVAGLAHRAFRLVRQRIASGCYLPGIERDLYAAGAELAEVAGWVAFDADRQSLATQLNHEALYLARLAGDRDIEHLILLNTSMQVGHLRRNRESIVTAQSVIDDRRISRRVHAMSLIRQGRAHARSGNRVDALRAFDQARSFFLDGLSDRDPAWAWWIDAEEIEGQHGAAHAELGDHRRAIPLLHNVVSADHAGAPRYRIVFAARLLHELVVVSAWRDAQQAAEDLSACSANIGSARAVALLRKTKNELDQQTNAPSTLRDTIHHVASQH